MDKQSVRERVQTALAAVTPAEVERRSRAVCATVGGLVEFRNAGVVMVYMPIATEVNVEPLAEQAWQSGKTVAVPKVDLPRRCMTPVVIYSLVDGFVDGSYNIREPSDGEELDPWRIDLVIAPAVAYDRRGNRLGRGGGFYDRFLASCPWLTVVCGVAFAEQLLEEIPVTENDMPVDLIVTDTEVLRFSDGFADQAAQERNG
ncbi:MAG: 5-formyltetrahydrofolate cyclo-ligase [Phycisphaerae bacterium]